MNCRMKLEYTHTDKWRTCKFYTSQMGDSNLWGNSANHCTDNPFHQWPCLSPLDKEPMVEDHRFLWQHHLEWFFLLQATMLLSAFACCFYVLFVFASAFELLSLGYAFKLLQTSLEVVPNAMLRLKYMFTFNRISISGQSFYRTKFHYCD